MNQSNNESMNQSNQSTNESINWKSRAIDQSINQSIKYRTNLIQTQFRHINESSECSNNQANNPKPCDQPIMRSTNESIKNE
jgi:hypothetical protein